MYLCLWRVVHYSLVGSITPLTKVYVACPVLELSLTLVALTPKLDNVSSIPTLNTPSVEILVSVLVGLPTKLQVTDLSAPFVTVPCEI